MLKKISIAVTLIGYTVFMAVAVLVACQSTNPHKLLWPVMAAVCMMAVGIVAFSLCLSRERRGTVNKATEALIILSKPSR